MRLSTEFSSKEETQRGQVLKLESTQINKDSGLYAYVTNKYDD